MRLYPAIDIRGGRAVRLTKGDYDRMKVYNDDPAAVAREFLAAGAQWLHVVDLDGAREGVPQNAETIRALTSVGLKTEVGGGIRDEKRICEYLENGVSRVILGTVAVRDFGFVERMVAKYGEQIAVGVDAKDGCVAVSGWEEVSNRDAVELAGQMKEYGIRHLIYTDIATDGMLSGPNLAAMTRMAEAFGPGVIASGGVSREQDLLELLQTGVSGAIVGKALYTGSIDLEKAIKTVKEASNAD